jgi:beta-fructofuranosidase
MLRLNDRWLWDFWFARDGDDYHVFYLQAPRSLGDPNERHWNASIGHAVSQDLQTWSVLPDALGPGEAGTWDDRSTWTGSILRAAGRWHLFYTGVSTREDGTVQRIGVATSEDLLSWRKDPASPLLEADPRWYEKLDPTAWHEEAWRDPWVFWHAPTSDYRMFMTARASTGPPDGRGVVGHARSSDLRRWQVLPPLTQPGEYGHMEVPQLVEIDGRCYLLFSVYEWAHSARRQQRVQAMGGTHYLVADHALGPYDSHSDEFLSADAYGSRYAGKILQAPDGTWVYLSFAQFPDGEEFRGDLNDPVPVVITPDGQLRLGQS